MVTFGNIPWQVLEGDGSDGVIAQQILGGQHKRVAFLQNCFSVLELAQTDFRSFGVQQGCQRNIQLFSQFFYHIQALLMLLVASVRKVKTGNVHSRFDHFP